MNILRFMLLPGLLLLAACGKQPAITIPEDKQVLFGVWEYQGREFDNNVTSDDMLLIFHKNSTASYKHCINRLNGYSYTTIPDAKLIELSNDNIILAKDIWITDWKTKLKIDSWPYQADGHWQMKVNGRLLKKLNPGEKSSHQQWPCSKDEQKKDNSKQDVHF